MKTRWTEKMDTIIRTDTERGRSSARIARRLGCSVRAVRHRAYDIGCAPAAINYTVDRTAQMLGVSDHVIKRWITLGALHATNNGTQRFKHYLVTEDDLYNFLDDERWWHFWDASTIVDGVYGAYARQLRQGKGWLTTTQVGAILGYCRFTVTVYIHRGYIRAVPRGRACSFGIREDWLDDARTRLANGGPPWWGTDPLNKPLWLAFRS